METIVVRPALNFFWLLTLSFLLLGSTYALAQKADPLAQSSADKQPENPSSAAVVESETAEPAEIEKQDPSTATKSPPSQPALFVPEAKRNAAPDVYLLPDESGRLRKVLGFRYEDFLEAWGRDQSEIAVAPPRQVIDSVTVSGEVLDAYAQLRIEFVVTVSTDHWVDIPIQLPNLIVQKLTVDDQVEGECLVYDQQRHGYVIWLSGKPGTQRKFVLEGLTKLKLNPGSTGIELFLPRATSSQCALRVPSSNTRFESSPELALTKIGLDHDTTEVRLLGQASPLRLNWTHADENSAGQTALVEATGQTTVQLESHRVLYNALLKINSLSGSLQQVRVKLPLGAKLSAEQLLDDFVVEQVESLDAPNKNQIVTIRRPASQQSQSQSPQAQAKAWEIRLAAEQTLRPSANSTECQIEGFEVLDAFRQSGAMTLEIDDRLQAYFDRHPDLNQVPQDDTVVASTGMSVLGEFRYSRFPWRLMVFASPRQKRISVKPRYDLFVSSAEARLDVQYDYQLTGAQIFSLRIDLNGWEMTEAPIESRGLIAPDVIVNRDNFLILRLVDPDTQRLPLNFSLSKKIQPGENAFVLPTPKDTFVVRGDLLVESAESLRVTPDTSEMKGLSVIATPGDGTRVDDSISTVLQDSGDSLEQFRFRTFLSQPKFVAQVEIKQREVSAQVETQVEVNQQLTRVHQRFEYLSKYRPVSQLSLDIPNQLWLNDSLTVTLNGEPLPLELNAYLGEELNESVREGNYLRQVTVTLPRPMQNAIPIEIAYEVPALDLNTEDTVAVTLPLVAPLDRVRSHDAVVKAKAPLTVSANQHAMVGQWTIIAEEKQPEHAATTIELTTDQTESSLTFSAQLDSAEEKSTQLATLERAWIQSWVTPSNRQERAVFRFRTTYPKVFAQLPDSMDDVEVEVILDGEPQEYELLAGSRLAITLPRKSQHSSLHNDHTVELRYQQPSTLPGWGRLQSELPQLECRDTTAPIYWQLILPRSWQVTTAPRQLTSDYWLGWKNYRWGRQPTLTQAYLEQITSAVTAEAPAPLSTQYVFRAFELPTSIQVTVIRQAWLFVASAILVFGIGLLWLYTSIAQNGVFWLVLTAIFLAGIFIYPELTLLAIQATLTGGLMTFVASVLRRTFAGHAGPIFVGTATSHELPTQITESWQQQADLRQEAEETTATLRTGGPLP